MCNETDGCSADNLIFLRVRLRENSKRSDLFPLRDELLRNIHLFLKKLPFIISSNLIVFSLYSAGPTGSNSTPSLIILIPALGTISESWGNLFPLKTILLSFSPSPYPCSIVRICTSYDTFASKSQKQLYQL